MKHIGCIAIVGAMLVVSSAEARPKTSTGKSSEKKAIHHSRMQLDAAKELAKGFAPLGFNRVGKSGLQAVSQWLELCSTNRWRKKWSTKARKRWLRVMGYFRLWLPAPMYRDIRHKRLHPRWLTKIRGKQSVITAPSRSEGWKGEIGSGQFQSMLIPLKRRRARDRRPYRLTIRSVTSIPPVRIKRLDEVFQFLLGRFTDTKLWASLPREASSAGKDKRWTQTERVGWWMRTRLPRTARLFGRYFKIVSGLKPMGNGFFKLDLRMRWKLKRLKKDYPRMAKVLGSQKSDFRMKMRFMDAKKRLWFLWTYNSKLREQRYQAVINKDGLWMCNSQWKPIAGPWRFTQLGASWQTSSTIRFRSNAFSATSRNLVMKWKVRGLRNGGSLSMALAQPPKLTFRGQNVLRFFSRLFVSGGVRGLARRFLANLAYGDGGKGFRCNWTTVESLRQTFMKFVLRMPIVPQSTLTTVLRFASGRAAKRPKKKSKYRPLWNRIFDSLYHDFREANQRMASL